MLGPGILSSTVLSTGTMTFTILMPSAGTFTLPIEAGGDNYYHNFTVTWGDTSSSTITSYNDVDRTHTYASSGSKTITMTGRCEYFNFNAGGDCALVTAITGFTNDIGFENLSFNGCYNLTSTVALGTKASLRNTQGLFSGCSSLASLPANLLDGCVNTTTLYYAFQGCTTITTVPSNLFRYNTEVTDFGHVFDSCTSLLSTNFANMFDYNTKAIDFQGAFYYCPLVTAIPTNFFRYNTAAVYFFQTFRNCQALASVGSDVFRYNTAATNFAYTFADIISASLTSLPTDLFRYNVLADAFYDCFYQCTGLGNSALVNLFKYNVNAGGMSETFANINAGNLTALPNDLFKYISNEPGIGAYVGERVSRNFKNIGADGKAFDELR